MQHVWRCSMRSLQAVSVTCRVCLACLALDINHCLHCQCSSAALGDRPQSKSPAVCARTGGHVTTAVLVRLHCWPLTAHHVRAANCSPLLRPAAREFAKHQGIRACSPVSHA